MRAVMFVAGIEIFFGFVAGALILLAGISLLKILYYLGVATVDLISEATLLFNRWLVRRAGWVCAVLA
jgi:hypothetical protein